MIFFKKICLSGAAALLLCGCLPAFLKKAPPYSIAGWETWPGTDNAYGWSEIKEDGLYYYLTARQDDTREEPSDGYFPGLILSRELAGNEWTLDMEADFSLPQGKSGRFSCGVWLGDSNARPDLGNFSSNFILLFRYQAGTGENSLVLTHIPGGTPHTVPKKAKVIRFERRGNDLAMSYALNRKDFIQVFRTTVADAGGIPAQKFFIGGYAGGEAPLVWSIGQGVRVKMSSPVSAPATKAQDQTQSARARFKSLKLNGKELLRNN